MALSSAFGALLFVPGGPDPHPGPVPACALGLCVHTSGTLPLSQVRPQGVML